MHATVTHVWRFHYTINNIKPVQTCKLCFEKIKWTYLLKYPTV